MADNRKMAGETAKSVMELLQQPTLCAMHNVKPESVVLMIVVVDTAGNRSMHDATGNLPEHLNPRRRNNRGRQYSFRLETSCTIAPFFNMSGLPGIGQIPIIGGPTQVRLVSEVPVESLQALSN